MPGAYLKTVRRAFFRPFNVKQEPAAFTPMGFHRYVMPNY